MRSDFGDIAWVQVGRIGTFLWITTQLAKKPHFPIHCSAKRAPLEVSMNDAGGIFRQHSAVPQRVVSGSAFLLPLCHRSPKHSRSGLYIIYQGQDTGDFLWQPSKAWPSHAPSWAESHCVQNASPVRCLAHSLSISVALCAWPSTMEF